MLRLALDSHHCIECVDEKLPLLPPRNTEKPYLGYKIPRLAEQLTRPVFADLAVGECPSFYRDERVIFIVRDPRDVVASMTNLKINQSESWLYRCGVGGLDYLCELGHLKPHLADRLQQLRSTSAPDYLYGALYWMMKNQGIWDLENAGVPLLLVEYEALVESPESHLRRICDFIGAPWDEGVLQHHANKSWKTDAEGLVIGRTDPNRRIDEVSIGRYRSLFTDLQSREILEYVAEVGDPLRSILATRSC
jgi:hypothetical protein